MYDYGVLWYIWAYGCMVGIVCAIDKGNKKQLTGGNENEDETRTLPSPKGRDRGH